MTQGTITFFDTQHGYGFITVDGLDYAVFFHVRAILSPSAPRPQVGQRVVFDLVSDLQVPRAANLTLAPHSRLSTPRYRNRLHTAPHVARCSGPRPNRGVGIQTTEIRGRTTPRTGYPYTHSRVLHAPVTKVWQVWTRPEHFARWLNAPLPSTALDIRPGGSWQAVVVAPDGTEHPMSGSYVEVNEHRHLRYTVHTPNYAEPMVLDITLIDLGDHTQIVFTQTSATTAQREQVKTGSERALDSLAAYLTTGSGG